ncbi:MAG: hypothetical protein Q4C47_05995, partial [Planctomycetia bacterium]|nr:hypothetical protein [Planctomycetia bacterium]
DSTFSPMSSMSPGIVTGNDLVMIGDHRETTEGQGGTSEIRIEIEADGFLYNMVRAITGTLVQVGKGRWPPEYVAEILRMKNRTAAGANAPPHGLCLVRVVY